MVGFSTWTALILFAVPGSWQKLDDIAVSYQVTMPFANACKIEFRNERGAETLELTANLTIIRNRPDVHSHEYKPEQPQPTDVRERRDLRGILLRIPPSGTEVSMISDCYGIKRVDVLQAKRPVIKDPPSEGASSEEKQLSVRHR